MARLMSRETLAKLKGAFAKIPIFGELTKTSFKAQKEATIEMLLTLIFSTLPIWFGGLRVAANKYFSPPAVAESTEKVTDISFLSLYWEALIKGVSNGELLMYSAALLGPTLYLAFASFARKKPPFPWVRPQVISAVLINFIAAQLFFASRENNYSDSPDFIAATLCLYAITLFMLFPAMAYAQDRMTFDSSEVQREEQKDYQQGYANHRGQ